MTLNQALGELQKHISTEELQSFITKGSSYISKGQAIPDEVGEPLGSVLSRHELFVDAINANKELFATILECILKGCSSGKVSDSAKSVKYLRDNLHKTVRHYLKAAKNWTEKNGSAVPDGTSAGQKVASQAFLLFDEIKCLTEDPGNFIRDDLPKTLQTTLKHLAEYIKGGKKDDVIEIALDMISELDKVEWNNPQIIKKLTLNLPKHVDADIKTFTIWRQKSGDEEKVPTNIAGEKKAYQAYTFLEIVFSLYMRYKNKDDDDTEDEDEDEIDIPEELYKNRKDLINDLIMFYTEGGSDENICALVEDLCMNKIRHAIS